MEFNWIIKKNGELVHNTKMNEPIQVKTTRHRGVYEEETFRRENPLGPPAKTDFQGWGWGMGWPTPTNSFSVIKHTLKLDDGEDYMAL